MSDDRKPFVCVERGCGMQFTNEDHLAVHLRKHDFSLALNLSATPGGLSPLSLFSDQTPTPTKFLKNCEELGLFQELSKNPFDDSFKKAMDEPGLAGVENSLQLPSETGDLDTPQPPVPRIMVGGEEIGEDGKHLSSILPKKRKKYLTQSTSLPTSTTSEDEDEAMIGSSSNIDITVTMDTGSLATTHPVQKTSSAADADCRNSGTEANTVIHISDDECSDSHVITNSSGSDGVKDVMITAQDIMSAMVSGSRQMAGTQDSSPGQAAGGVSEELIPTPGSLISEEAVSTPSRLSTEASPSNQAKPAIAPASPQLVTVMLKHGNQLIQVQVPPSMIATPVQQQQQSLQATVHQANVVPQMTTVVQPVTQSTSPLAQGNAQLALGAFKLAQGTNQLAQGTTRLVQGTSQIAQGTTPLAHVTAPLAQGNPQSVQATPQLLQTSSGQLIQIQPQPTPTAIVQAAGLNIQQPSANEILQNLLTQQVGGNVLLNQLQATNSANSATNTTVQSVVNISGAQTPVQPTMLFTNMNSTLSQLQQQAPAKSAIREALTLPVKDSPSVSGSTKERLKAALQQQTTPTHNQRVGQVFTVKQEPQLLQTDLVTSSVGVTSPPSMNYFNPAQADQSSPDSGDHERRTKFLERNRAAAARCREKRKRWVDTLQKKAEDLSTVNNRLCGEIKKLRSEVADLKTLLLAHKDCPVTAQQRMMGHIPSVLIKDANPAAAAANQATSNGSEHSLLNQSTSLTDALYSEVAKNQSASQTLTSLPESMTLLPVTSVPVQNENTMTAVPATQNAFPMGLIPNVVNISTSQPDTKPQFSVITGPNTLAMLPKILNLDGNMHVISSSKS